MAIPPQFMRGNAAPTGNKTDPKADAKKKKAAQRLAELKGKGK